MSALSCLHCSKWIHIHGYILAAILRCPSCGNDLFAGRGQGEDAEWLTQLYDQQDTLRQFVGPRYSEPAEELTRLLAPHPCHQCHGPIDQVIGKARTTLECPACHHRTSVYAVTFRCRDCSILLEAPTAQAGRAHPCPGCRKPQQVPANVLERSVPAAENAADWFRFHCPSCWDHVVVKKADVGQRAACPHCCVTLDVPHCGYQVRETVEKKEPLPEVHCPRCALLIPMAATVCPLCGLDRKNE